MKLVGIGRKQSTAASHSGTGGSRRERGQLWFVSSPSPPVWLKIHFSCSTFCKAKFQEFCCSSLRQPKTAKLALSPQFSGLFLVNEFIQFRERAERAADRECDENATVAETGSGQKWNSRAVHTTEQPSCLPRVREQECVINSVQCHDRLRVRQTGSAAYSFTRSRREKNG